MTLAVVCILLTLGYLLLMVVYRKGWTTQPEFHLDPGYQPATSVTVIVPARNEACNIGRCLDSILAQNYPAALFEVIVVDDHSDDNTADIVNSFKERNVRCISLADFLPTDKAIVAYKKAAISAGVAQSKGSLIVTTDADCVVPETWLMHIAGIYEREHPAMVVAPVIYTSDKRISQVFQLIDFMSMQGITAATHQLRLGNMSNGANLAFSKAAFLSIGGYAGVDHLASGDDLLLMTKMNEQQAGGIAYLKSAGAIVSTAPQPDWGSFLLQRIRWASKSGKYNDTKLTLVLLLVYLFNCAFPVLLVCACFNPLYFGVAALMLVMKMFSEFYFLQPVAKYFDNEWVYPWFFLLQPLHIAYIVLAGFLGFAGVYKWKGRRVR